MSLRISTELNKSTMILMTTPETDMNRCIPTRTMSKTHTNGAKSKSGTITTSVITTIILATT